MEFKKMKCNFYVGFARGTAGPPPSPQVPVPALSASAALHHPIYLGNRPYVPRGTRLYDLPSPLTPTKKAEEDADPAVTRQKGSPGTKTWMASLSLEGGAGPAKAPIATAHLGEACKHTRGLSTCIVVSKRSLCPLSCVHLGLCLRAQSRRIFEATFKVVPHCHG
jgi:hypothetical protein